jgi:ribose transport system substrate-binding protein
MHKDGTPRRSRLRLVGGAAVSAAVLAAALMTTTVASGSSPATTAASAAGTQQCGQNVSQKPTDPDGVYAKLPKAIQARYGAWPFPIKKTPWAASKPVKGPWKIGYINFPITTPWQADLTSQLKVEFGKAKAKGLVSGSLQTYIQTGTPTPEQQIAAIQQMVRQGVNGIVMNPLAGPAEAPAIDAAGKAGVPVVFTDNTVVESKYAIQLWSENNGPADAGTAKIIGKGNVLIVRGIAGNPSEQIFENNALADIKACPGLKVVGSVNGNWNNPQAKTAVTQFLASHPTLKIDGVIQNGIMAAGIIDAFQQAGRPVPPVSMGGCQGGELSWWLAHPKYRTAGTCFNGYQTAYTAFRVLLRVLGGKGLKVNGIDIVPGQVTASNLKVYATANKPLSWQGEPLGPLDGWGSNAYLDAYFTKPGTPGGL